ncbi:hypothetical protein RFI_22679 [Reticulomyxa filosa]|uniref:Uncharacterized protein n=1 Tax=Reticulomyxa filosa TaxID=46433 RepID=X6MMM0_RETFI|nr:hypothetical protein RFI_22679 [Reticulomyxa filosa]|eukprot:ETO14687.1 hypothetical protein RFI_22679 [Reticulomyxa filosa]
MFEESQFIYGKEDSRQSASRNSNAEIRDWKNMAYKGLTLQIGARHLSCDEVEQNNRVHCFLQYDICKEIYSLRLDYWEKGGRLETSSFKLTANESIQKLCDNAKSNGKYDLTNGRKCVED